MISIHVPARGTTRRLLQLTLGQIFQSTYPHGVRLGLEDPRDTLKRISIHVPARGTTRRELWAVCLMLQFQSTYPHGVRRGLSAASIYLHIFQSTYPHGVRPMITHADPHVKKFQSTYRTGYDDRDRAHPDIPDISIHVPARGTTWRRCRLFHEGIYFNPRTRTGYDESHSYHRTCR